MAEMNFSHCENTNNKYALALYGISPNATLIIQNETIIDCNDAAINIFKCKFKEEIIGLKLRDLSPKTQKDEKCLEKKEKDIIRKAVREKFFNSDWVFLRGNGETFLAEITLRYSGGRIYIYIHNITEKKLTQYCFQQLFENSPEAIAILDNNLNIIDINKSFEKLFQYSSDEIKGKGVGETICSQEFCNGSCIFLELKEKGYMRKEIKKKRKNGEIIFTDLLTYPIFKGKKQIGIYSIYRDVTENKKNLEKIQYLAFRDSVTGLYNRDFFLEKLQYQISKGQNNKFALLFLDFDNFKRINNTLGYLIGDKIIKLVADKLAQIADNKHIIARICGNHFTLLVSEIDHEEDVMRIAKKIIGIFDNPIRIDEYELSITVSIGISMYPKDGSNKEILIKKADIAMYKAKDKYGNKVVVYSEHMIEETKEEFVLVNDLQKALYENQLKLYYQPIVDLKTNEIVAAEALLRWEHPKLGFIPPSKFIPIAENNGLILGIGEWVLKTACLQNKKWQRDGYKSIIISVNVSVRQFEQKNFVNSILRILNETGLSPEFLELEITESLYIKNINSCTNSFQRLNEMGISISIDDFGTGYSSLGQLRSLAINKLKIDKSFIDDIKNETDENPIISAIIAISRSLKLETIAEGIENSWQLNYLKNLNCEMGQGYIFSKPVDVQLFQKLLKRGL